MNKAAANALFIGSNGSLSPIRIPISGFRQIRNPQSAVRNREFIRVP